MHRSGQLHGHFHSGIVGDIALGGFQDGIFSLPQNIGEIRILLGKLVDSGVQLARDRFGCQNSVDRALIVNVLTGIIDAHQLGGDRQFRGGDLEFGEMQLQDGALVALGGLHGLGYLPAQQGAGRNGKLAVNQDGGGNDRLNPIVDLRCLRGNFGFEADLQFGSGGHIQGKGGRGQKRAHKPGYEPRGSGGGHSTARRSGVYLGFKSRAHNAHTISGASILSGASGGRSCNRSGSSRQWPFWGALWGGRKPPRNWSMTAKTRRTSPPRAWATTVRTIARSSRSTKRT